MYVYMGVRPDVWNVKRAFEKVINNVRECAPENISFVTTYQPVKGGGTTRPGFTAITGVTFATVTKSEHVTTYVPILKNLQSTATAGAASLFIQGNKTTSGPHSKTKNDCVTFTP